MEKHRFNIFPEMSAEEYEKLKSDISANGYDSSQKIVIYEGAILDGWNRYKACQELDKDCSKRDFIGDPIEAMQFVMRTNKRRNLTSSQWAAIAVEAEEIVEVLREATEKERREKQAESLRETHAEGRFGVSDKSLSDTHAEELDEILSAEQIKPKELTYTDEHSQVAVKPKKDEHANKSATKLAKIFPTNRTYINENKKIKKTSPEVFEKVKSGEITIPQAKKEIELQFSPKEEVPISKQKEESATDKITKLAAKHARIIHDALHRYSVVVTNAKNDFAEAGMNFNDFAKINAAFRTEHSKQDLLNLKAEMRLLKNIKICPKCKGQKCGRCGELGYLTNDDYKDLKKELEGGY